MAENVLDGPGKVEAAWRRRTARHFGSDNSGRLIGEVEMSANVRHLDNLSRTTLHKLVRAFIEDRIHP